MLFLYINLNAIPVGQLSPKSFGLKYYFFFVPEYSPLKLKTIKKFKFIHEIGNHIFFSGKHLKKSIHLKTLRFPYLSLKSQEKLFTAQTMMKA